MAYPKKRPGEHLGNPHHARGAEPDSGPFDRVTSRRDEIPIPSADPSWKPKARSWFNSLKLSAQTDLWEASDWATAVAAADAYNLFLLTWNASIFAQFVRLSERLGCTVSDRKKARIELAEPDPQDEDEDAADDAVMGWHGRLSIVK